MVKYTKVQERLVRIYDKDLHSAVDMIAYALGVPYQEAFMILVDSIHQSIDVSVIARNIVHDWKTEE